jgi:mannose/fructose/N-acetylgalactosamine-specific phosphotransferase system component IIB
MPLVLVRIDSRLVHGQVVEGWVPHVKANCLLVVNDDLAANPFLRSVMELAGTPSLRIVFCTLDEVAQAAAEIAGRGEKAILLCSTPADAARIYAKGVHFTDLNIGNLHFGTGRVEITPSVFFAPEDYEAVEALQRQGVAVEVRGTPFEPGKPIRGGGGWEF